MNEKRLQEVEKLLKEGKAYVASSIEGEGMHIGRFIGLTLDANGDVIILCDIDKMSTTK